MRAHIVDWYMGIVVIGKKEYDTYHGTVRERLDGRKIPEDKHASFEVKENSLKEARKAFKKYRQRHHGC